MDPGTGLAIVSLSFQVFAGCIKGFVFVTDAYNLHKDAAVERTKLLIQEQRLVEWAKAVNLHSPDARVAAWLNQVSAAIILAQLGELLNSAEALKKRYGIELRSPTQAEVDGAAASSSSDVVPSSPILAPLATQNARQDILQQASRRFSITYVPKRLWWASVDKRKYEKLAADVTSLVDGLWALLTPAMQMQTSQALNEILRHVIQLSHDVDGLRQLQMSLQPAPVGGDGADVHASLAASAGIRAATIAMAISQGDEDDSRVRALNSASLLKASDVTDINMGSSSIGIAQYSGQRSESTGPTTLSSTVIIENRIVEPSLKRKLRSRVTDLAALLSKPAAPSFLTLRCIGFTEEPTGFHMLFDPPATLAEPLTRPPHTLLDALRSAAPPLPPAGARLALATTLAATVLAFHTAGWLHKDLRAANVLLFAAAPGEPARPFLGGFSFARRDSVSEISENPERDWRAEVYRHPHAQEKGRLAAGGFQRYMDCYALGCVLVEIAEWAPLLSVVKSHVDLARRGDSVSPEEVAGIRGWLVRRFVEERRAHFRLGDAFGRFVRLCFVGQGEGGDGAGLRAFHEVLEEMSRCRI